MVKFFLFLAFSLPAVIQGMEGTTSAQKKPEAEGQEMFAYKQLLKQNQMLNTMDAPDRREQQVGDILRLQSGNTRHDKNLQELANFKEALNRTPELWKYLKEKPDRIIPLFSGDEQYAGMLAAMACTGDHFNFESDVIHTAVNILEYLNEQKQQNAAATTELLQTDNTLGELAFGMYSEAFSGVLQEDRQKVVEYFHQHPRMATELASALHPSSDITLQEGASIEELTALSYNQPLIEKITPGGVERISEYLQSRLREKYRLSVLDIILQKPEFHMILKKSPRIRFELYHGNPHKALEQLESINKTAEYLKKNPELRKALKKSKHPGKDLRDFMSTHSAKATD